MDFTTIIKTVAPWIGTALAGPFGGMALTAAANALGLPEATTEAVKAAINGATPDQLLAVKKADQDFAVQMQQLGFQSVAALEAIAAGDRKDARELLKTTRSWVPAALSGGVTVGYFTILIGLMTGHMEVTDSQAMLLMLGSLTTAWGVVMAFWFGTTADSGRKTELLAASNPPSRS
jgi:hypothetical protein